MKKRFLFLTLSCILYLIITSCSGAKYEYTLKYVVFYPGFNDAVTVKNNKGYYMGSDMGSNYIHSYDGKYVYDGSAPYKILKYNSREIKEDSNLNEK